MADEKTVIDSGKTKDDNSKTACESKVTKYEVKRDTVPNKSDAVSADAYTPFDGVPFDGVPFDGVPSDGVTFEKGSVILDTYRVEGDPIHGGMGSVWRVHHAGWNTDLAMKRPKPELFQSEEEKEMFIGECDAWINLGLHPNIVSCFYVREIEGTPTIFSEWMDGGSLKDAIERETLYTGTEAEQKERLLDVTIQFARGLHCAHQNGLIHQDVKPDNLLLTKEGDVKVADFGIARARATLTVLEVGVAKENADGTMFSASGAYTPAYCSMEQMDGKVLTRRTDIYSWAVSVMEMYIGSRPWMNGVVAGLSCRGYFEDARVSMPKTLKELLAKCMETEPDDRPHDFAEIETELIEIYRVETGGDYPRPVPKAAVETSDSLNNRALSMLDLGKPGEAVRCWERAASITPLHVPTFYNRLLFRWRSAELDDIEAFEQMERFSAFCHGSLVSLAKALLHVEHGDWKTARSLLSEVAADDCRGDLLEHYTALVRNYDAVERFPYLEKGRFVKFFGEMILFFTEDEFYVHDAQSGDLLFTNRTPGFHVRNFIPVGRDDSFILISSQGEAAFYSSLRSEPVVQVFSRPGDPNRDYYTRVLDFVVDDGMLSVYMDYKSSNGTYDENRIFVNKDSETRYEMMHYVDCTNGAYLGNEILFYHNGPYWDDDCDEHYPPSPRARKTLDIFEVQEETSDEPEENTPNRALWLRLKKYNLYQVCLDDGHCIHTLRADEIIHKSRTTLMYICDADKENYRMLRFLDADQQVPWLVSKPYVLLTALAQETQANNDVQEFYAAYDSGDISKALRYFEDYRDLPGRENDEQSRLMEDDIARYCVPVGIRYAIKQEAAQREYFEETRHFLPVPDLLQKKVKKAWNRARHSYYPHTQKCDKMALFPNGRVVVFSVPQKCRKDTEWRSLYLYDTASEEIRVLKDGYLDDELLQSWYTPISPDFLVMVRNFRNYVLLPPLPERIIVYAENEDDNYHRVYFHPSGRFLLLYLKDRNIIRINHMLHWNEVCDTSGFTVYDIKEPCYEIYNVKPPELKEFSRFTDNAEFELREGGRKLHVRPNDDPNIEEQISLSSGEDINLSRDCRELLIRYYATVKTFDNDQVETTKPYIDVCRYISYNYEFPGWTDWDEGAQSYLDIFLNLHPDWTENDFDGLITELQYHGFGYIRPEGVRAKLAEMTMEKNSPLGKRK